MNTDRGRGRGKGAFRWKAALVVLCLTLTAPAMAAQQYGTLRPGDAGPLVVSMQSALEHLRFLALTDGKYGPATRDAVKRFQSSRGLQADGLAGQRTLAELYRLAPQYEPSQGGSQTAVRTQPPDTGILYRAEVDTANRGSLNLRREPSPTGAVLLRIPCGAGVAVISRNGAWSGVSYGGLTGFVVSDHLRREDPPPSPAPTPDPAGSPTPAQSDVPSMGTAFVNTPDRGSLNLRSAPASGLNVIAQVPHGARLSVLAQLGDWVRVSTESQTGYVLGRFLRFGTDGQTPAAQLPPDSTDTPQAGGGEAVVSTVPGRSLNLRSSPSTGGGIIAQIPSGTRIGVLVRGTDWCEVRYGARRGFVMSSYLTFGPAETPAPTPEPTPLPPPSPTPTAAPIPTPIPDEAGAFPRTLRLGDQGQDVQALQEMLRALGYACPADGTYDAATQEAVRGFQRKNSLAADGVFGRESAGMILSPHALAADSPPLDRRTLRVDDVDGEDAAVSQMQQALKALGYPLEVNGRFDVPTHQAVVAFQQRNGLPLSGIASPVMQSALYAAGAKGYATPVEPLAEGEGRGQGPSAAQVRLLHWFTDVKPSASAGQNAVVYHPGSDISFTIRFYSMGRHADSEPATWRDTQLMNRAFGTPSWNINTVYVRLPDGRWTLAAMHNRPHLTGAVSSNGFGGHLCIHFLRDMDEVMQNDPDYGAANQRAIRKAWLSLTGETVQ